MIKIDTMASSGAGIVCLFLVLCSAVPSLATLYTVGDSSGWTLGVDYSTWTSGKTFMVGDSLVFNYGSGHTVDEVSGSDYSTCTVGNPINTDNSGSTTISLKADGTHYYICGVIGHCGSDMKLAINVAGATTTAPSGAPPSGNTTTSPAPLMTVTTPPATVLESSSPETLSPFIAMLIITWVALFKFALL